MRIRPVVITGTGAVIALAAIATVVLATTPQEAGPGLIRLLWVAVFLAAWSLTMTLILVMRQSLAQAVWAGLWPAIAVVCLLMARQRGPLAPRLLLGTVLATLGVSVFIGWRLSHQRAHD